MPAWRLVFCCTATGSGHFWMVRSSPLPAIEEADWREETAKVKKYPIQADLVDAPHQPQVFG